MVSSKKDSEDYLLTLVNLLTDGCAILGYNFVVVMKKDPEAVIETLLDILNEYKKASHNPELN